MSAGTSHCSFPYMQWLELLDIKSKETERSGDIRNTNKLAREYCSLDTQQI